MIGYGLNVSSEIEGYPEVIFHQIYFLICGQKVNDTFDSFGTQRNEAVFILEVIPVTLTLALTASLRLVIVVP